MVTGASTANLAIILIDARKGILEQTHRHSFIASLLNIPHLVVCVNKMDLVDYSQNRYNEIVREYEEFASKLNVKDVRFIPISALNGDNVVNKSENMPWYEGSTLLYNLETVHISSDFNLVDCRFPVQSVIRPHTMEHQDFRGYAGRIDGGVFKPGDKIQIMPSGFKSTIKTIELDGKQLQEAFPPMSVTMTLNDDVDVSRGDMIVRENNVPHEDQDLDLMICWMDKSAMSTPKKVYIKHTTKDCLAIVKDIKYKLDINTLHRIEGVNSIGMNDIARITVRSSQPLFMDTYNRNRMTGSVILIDEATNNTVAAGMILDK
jgi:sulfate adenylyltransferase subunit 1